jgi:hypothetical protein
LVAWAYFEGVADREGHARLGRIGELAHALPDQPTVISTWPPSQRVSRIKPSDPTISTFVIDGELTSEHGSRETERELLAHFTIGEVDDVLEQVQRSAVAGMDSPLSPSQ